MFKNAGTTLDWSLRRCFGECFVDHRDDQAMRHSSGYLSTYIEQHASIQALSSHWLPVPLPDMHGIAPRLLILLRNPLERSRSVYNFERAQRGSNAPGNKKARELSFRDYVKWRLRPGAGPVIQNFHTRYCSGNYFGKDMHQLYEQAIANLDSIPLAGLVHRYAESMVLFENGLAGAFPGIDLSWKIQNASQDSANSTAERERNIATDLGGIFSELMEANSYDLKLLQYLEKRLERELSTISDMDARLRSLQQRNQLLQ